MITNLSDRCEVANHILETISLHGRRFFYSEAFDRIAHFYIDEYNQVWLVDHHTGMKVNPFKNSDWIGFSLGATAKELIVAMGDYVRNGTPIPMDHFRKEWGYGEDMKKVVDAALETGALVDSEQGDK